MKLNNAPDWLALRAKSHPDCLFIRYKAKSYTFRLVHWLTSNLCQQLEPCRASAASAPMGILVSDPLLTCLLVLAAARHNWPAVVLSERLSDQQLQDQCAFLNLKLVVVSDQEPVQICRNLGPGCGKTVVSEPEYSRSLGSDKKCSDLSMRGGLNALQGYVFSSGTTGRPKAIPLTFSNHFWSATASAYRLGYTQNDCWLHCMPVSHVGGLSLLFRALLFGFGLHLTAGFHTQEIKRIILRGEVTMASLVPTMLVRLLDANLRIQSAASPFRFALVGGAKVSTALRARSRQHGIRILPSFGMTETCSHATAVVPARQEQDEGEGPPLLFAQVSIRGGGRKELSAQKDGEVWIKGPQVSQARTDPEGWLQTGDLGYLDRQGCLHVRERSQDVYSIGGEKVSSAQARAIVEQFPGVQDCWILAVPDREWGWRLVALVVPEPGIRFTQEDLVVHCRKSLSAVHAPQVFRFVDAIPRSPTGKVLRRQVQELMEDFPA